MQINSSNIPLFIRKELEKKGRFLSNKTYENLRVASFENSNLVIEIDDIDSYNEIYEHLELIKQILKDILELFYGTIKLEIIKNFEEESEIVSSYKEYLTNTKFKSNLNSNYTFDNYIVGENNMFAFNLANSMIEGELINNPLCFYGNSGLGKTHLAQAMGNQLLKENPNKKVLYITSNDFSNELASSFLNKTTISFKEKFRSLDMLIVDDIQFFEKVFGKGDDIIQKEFYDAFNNLYMNNKPIVLISDKFPNQIKNVEERLVSRLTSGVTVELKMPDKSVRISIINDIVNKEKIKINEELILYIADELDTNIRDIRGFMATISAISKLMPNQEINKELIDTEINKRKIMKKKSITLDKILNTVINYYGIKKEDLVGKKRNTEYVIARDAAKYLLANNLQLTLTQVGKVFSTDHTNIVKTIRRLEELESKEPENQRILDLEELKNRIEG